MEDYNVHVGCFIWIKMHHGEKVVKSWEKIRKFPYLEKFCYENFQIQNPNFQKWFFGEQVSYFDMSWWFMTLGTWFWPKSQSLTFQYTIDFWSVDCKIHLSIRWTWDLLNHAIRSRLFHWVLEIMLVLNWPLARLKIRNFPFSVQTLILTILPFWRSDQISWGVMVQT